MRPNYLDMRLCFPCASQASDPDPHLDISFVSFADPDSPRNLDVAPDERWSRVQQAIYDEYELRTTGVFIHGKSLPLVPVTVHAGTPYCAFHAAAFAALPVAGRN